MSTSARQLGAELSLGRGSLHPGAVLPVRTVGARSGVRAESDDNAVGFTDGTVGGSDVLAAGDDARVGSTCARGEARHRRWNTTVS